MTHALIPLLALTSGCMGSDCHSDPTPSTETCEPTGEVPGTVTDVTLGRWDGQSFTPYLGDDIVPITYGGQGFPMLVFNLRVRGSDLPGCLPQRTTIWRDGVAAYSETLPLVADRTLPDTWITGEMLIVTFDLYGGERIGVETVVGEWTNWVDVWVEYRDTTVVDGGRVPDAAQLDAEFVPDAAPPDAAP